MAAEQEALQAFQKWLEAHGAQLHGLHVRPCATSNADLDHWGLGLYTNHLEAPPEEGVLCRIPLDNGLALTPRRCLDDPVLGTFFADLLAEGHIDGHMCIMLYLVVQRALGPRSALAPYLAVLPHRVPVPLTWSDSELQALKGTPLLAAIISKRRHLQAQWEAQVEPVLQSAFALVGVDAAPCARDWVWSYTLVWSRLLEWPAPNTISSEESDMEEGLLPFIDFCNHDAASPVQRAVVGNTMILSTATPLPPHSQVCISYGDKGNEELLFLYGFALPVNSCDRLLLHTPPSRLHSTGALEARLSLLQTWDLALRWLLPDPQASVEAAAAAWQEALAAAHVVTMPTEVVEQLAASEDPQLDLEEQRGVSKAESAKGGATEAAVRWLEGLLEERLQKVEEGKSEPAVDELASAGWADMLTGDCTIGSIVVEAIEAAGVQAAARAKAESRGRAMHCAYYLASERRLCKAYLERAAQTLRSLSLDA